MIPWKGLELLVFKVPEVLNIIVSIGEAAEVGKWLSKSSLITDETALGTACGQQDL